MAHRYRNRRNKFTVGIGATADMNGRVASAVSVATDPIAAIGRSKFRSAVGFPRWYLPVGSTGDVPH
jgi:hypothetical protein